ncbi:tetratricopeptide repeat protein [Woodsholea maritima]|uniref:tetratricopeptide repeat protein n=1 Tax=Woodsholea maritima TaxID=240237 RepID=UPI00035CF77C|nr:tetratricopeptide repeat protein [Woodsholea maritima]
MLRFLAALGLACAVITAPGWAQNAETRAQLCPQGYEALSQEEAEGAIAAFRACLTQRQYEWTQEAELRARLGAAYLVKGDAQDALMAYNQVLALIADHDGNSENVLVRRNRGAAYMQLGRYEDALGDLQIAARQVPHDAFLYLMLGSAHLELEEGPEAVAAFDQAVRLEPNYAPGWIGRSAALIEAGLTGRAVTDAQEAVAIEPDAADSLNALCWALVKDQRASEGLSICDAALDADPQSAAIIHSKAAALEQIGRTEEAHQLYARAYEADPEDLQISQDYRRIQGL